VLYVQKAPKTSLNQWAQGSSPFHHTLKENSCSPYRKDECGGLQVKKRSDPLLFCVRESCEPGGKK
jgi:hypothetical protein